MWTLSEFGIVPCPNRVARHRNPLALALALSAWAAAPPPLIAAERSGTNGTGATRITGEPKQWHKVTLTLDGPFARENSPEPNPFTDYRMKVVFAHESGTPRYTVPGYFAADGNAG